MTILLAGGAAFWLITTVLVVKTARSLAKTEYKVKHIFQEKFFLPKSCEKGRINIISVVFYFAVSDQPHEAESKFARLSFFVRFHGSLRVPTPSSGRNGVM